MLALGQDVIRFQKLPEGVMYDGLRHLGQDWQEGYWALVAHVHFDFFLYTGTTMAVFHRAGWRLARKAFESSLIHSVSARTGTPSGPVALAGGTFRISHSTVQGRRWTFSICAAERLRTGGRSLARRSPPPGLHLEEKNLPNASAFS